MVLGASGLCNSCKDDDRLKSRLFAQTQCPNCGFALESASRFCSECGTSISGNIHNINSTLSEIHTKNIIPNDQSVNRSANQSNKSVSVRKFVKQFINKNGISVYTTIVFIATIANMFAIYSFNFIVWILSLLIICSTVFFVRSRSLWPGKLQEYLHEYNSRKFHVIGIIFLFLGVTIINAILDYTRAISIRSEIPITLSCTIYALWIIWYGEDRLDSLPQKPAWLVVLFESLPTFSGQGASVVLITSIIISTVSGVYTFFNKQSSYHLEKEYYQSGYKQIENITNKLFDDVASVRKSRDKVVAAANAWRSTAISNNLNKNVNDQLNTAIKNFDNFCLYDTLTEKQVLTNSIAITVSCSEKQFEAVSGMFRVLGSGNVYANEVYLQIQTLRRSLDLVNDTDYMSIGASSRRLITEYKRAGEAINKSQYTWGYVADNTNLGFLVGIIVGICVYTSSIVIVVKSDPAKYNFLKKGAILISEFSQKHDSKLFSSTQSSLQDIVLFLSSTTIIYSAINIFAREVLLPVVSTGEDVTFIPWKVLAILLSSFITTWVFIDSISYRWIILGFFLAIGSLLPSLEWNIRVFRYINAIYGGVEISAAQMSELFAHYGFIVNGVSSYCWFIVFGSLFSHRHNRIEQTALTISIATLSVLLQYLWGSIKEQYYLQYMQPSELTSWLQSPISVIFNHLTNVLLAIIVAVITTLVISVLKGGRSTALETKIIDLFGWTWSRKLMLSLAGLVIVLSLDMIYIVLDPASYLKY